MKWFDNKFNNAADIPLMSLLSPLSAVCVVVVVIVVVVFVFVESWMNKNLMVCKYLDNVLKGRP